MSQLDELKQLSVLYVEDDLDIRQELAYFLGRRAGALYVAGDGREGLELFEQHRPDLVITDIMMPVMDGLKMTRGIHEMDMDVPVVVTTAFNDHDLLLQAIDAGVDKYVLKPIDTDLLVETVLRAAQSVFQRRAIRMRDEKLRLSARVLEATSEGIMVTDANGYLVQINRAFSEITGYSEDEVLGQSPRLLNSGRHSQEFFKAMWDTLISFGHWQGELWNRRRNGEIFPAWLVINAVRDGAGAITHYVGVFTDISQRKYDEARIAYLAHYDPLTELPNRVLFLEQLTRLLPAADRRQSGLALLLIDLDRFKNINESLGHMFGDQLLQQAAARLREAQRGEDVVARLGGDEYGVVLTEVESAQAAGMTAHKLLQAFTRPFVIDGQEVTVTISIGIALYHDDGDSADQLLKNAESAMYGAKQSGRNTYQFYTQSMTASMLPLVRMENAMHHALERNEFLLYYQPQVDLATGEVLGMEALVRWQHPERGLVPPMEFIPLAEDSGLIIPLGEWVLREACRQTRLWHDAGFNHLRVAVNLSAVQFKQNNLTDIILSAAGDAGLEPRFLELELTESLVMHNAEEMIETLRRLKSYELQLSIDDFGTGYSSMSYLKRFPVDRLKIDKSFTRDITTDPVDLSISQAIIALGHSLGLKVIAEGVETAEQLGLMRANRCDEMQGYLFSRPVDATRFEALLREGRRLALPE